MHRRSKVARRAGMALIEIVVVIAIMAMLASAVGMYAIARYRDSRVEIARTELETLEGALDSYLAIVGRYPDPAKGFGPLLERRLVKESPIDPWGTPFSWSLVSGVPVVVSLGEDGVTGGDGYAADLRSDASRGRRLPAQGEP